MRGPVSRAVGGHRPRGRPGSGLCEERAAAVCSELPEPLRQPAKHNAPSRKPAPRPACSEKPNPVTSSKTRLEKASPHNRMLEKIKAFIFLFYYIVLHTYCRKKIENTDKEKDKISHNLTTHDDRC